jgi:hypothetical protein
VHHSHAVVELFFVGVGDKCLRVSAFWGMVHRVQCILDSAGCMGMGIIMQYHDTPFNHVGMPSHDSGMSVTEFHSDAVHCVCAAMWLLVTGDMCYKDCKQASSEHPSYYKIYKPEFCTTLTK